MDYTDLEVTECLLGDDAEMLTFALDRVRKELAWKTGGLSAAQLRRRFPPSEMTLAGLIKHLSLVEERFTAMAEGREDEGAATDDEWESALSDDPETLYARWFAAIDRSRTAWSTMIADGGLSATVTDPDPAWTKNRRRILVDLLEENQIHLGHADLLREMTDGLRGHGWPGS